MSRGDDEYTARVQELSPRMRRTAYLFGDHGATAPTIGGRSVEYGVPGSKRWQVAVTLDTPSAGGKDALKRRQAWIAAMPAGTRFPTGGSEPFDTTVDGRRAYRRTVTNDLGTTEILRGTRVRGLEPRITTSNAGHGASENLLRGMTVLGPDPAAWTSRPFG